MNKTYCKGKFVFKDEMDAEDLKRERSLDAECAKSEMESFGKDRLKTVKRDRKLCREIRKAVFAYLESIGHKASDVEVVRQYASKRLENEEVVHFRLNGFWLKDYRFGMWINPKNFFMKDYGDMSKFEKAAFDKLPLVEVEKTRVAVQVFQQHKDSIDRFAPSYSEPVIEITRNDAKMLLAGYRSLVSRGEKGAVKMEYGQFGFDIESLGKLIAFMQKHPFKHFGGLLSHGKHLVWSANSEEISHPFLHFVKERTRFYFSRMAKSIRRWIGFRKAIRVCKGLAKEECVKAVRMTSFGNVVMPGCMTDHEFEIAVDFDGSYSLEEISDAFDRHVVEDNIGKVGKYGHVAEVASSRLKIVVEDRDKTSERSKRNGGSKCELSLDGWHGGKTERYYYDMLVRSYENINGSSGKGSGTVGNFLKKYPTLEDFLESRCIDPHTGRFDRVVEWPDGRIATVARSTIGRCR